ncbi:MULTISPECIES: acyl carrier protein [unclassified Pseudomonas]|uniref:acyl carrier protein n=1 Tax=unclassified Pseudomonas TaxID=196821 RepID=UPI00244B73E1|nr:MULTISPECIES: acyl carrier protein [unclassified Pseudomonas]MDH0304448.1 acyl carrier protein [Pseudomonas sp. GD04091]MDH1985617.1 acyl carrier protein [Pseudomonas sp. GD03689]
MPTALRDLAFYRDKLKSMIEPELRLPAGSLDCDRNLSEYGLDSIVALTIAGDLEDQLRIQLPPTLLWDYPTVDDLAGYLCRTVDQVGAPA